MKLFSFLCVTAMLFALCLQPTFSTCAAQDGTSNYPPFETDELTVSHVGFYNGADFFYAGFDPVLKEHHYFFVYPKGRAWEGWFRGAWFAVRIDSEVPGPEFIFEDYGLVTIRGISLNLFLSSEETFVPSGEVRLTPMWERFGVPASAIAIGPPASIAIQIIIGRPSR